MASSNTPALPGPPPSSRRTEFKAGRAPWVGSHFLSIFIIALLSRKVWFLVGILLGRHARPPGAPCLAQKMCSGHVGWVNKLYTSFILLRNKTTEGNVRTTHGGNLPRVTQQGGDDRLWIRMQRFLHHFTWILWGFPLSIISFHSHNNHVIIIICHQIFGRTQHYFL